MGLYLRCLRGHRGVAEPCRDLARAYLACRMSRYADAGARATTDRSPLGRTDAHAGGHSNLMAPAAWPELGFREDDSNRGGSDGGRSGPGVPAGGT
jgi:hypothetical protein